MTNTELQQSFTDNYEQIRAKLICKLRRMLEREPKGDATGDEAEIARDNRNRSPLRFNPSDLDEILGEALMIAWQLWQEHRPNCCDMTDANGSAISADNACVMTVSMFAAQRAFYCKGRLVGPMKPTKAKPEERYDVTEQVIALLPAESRPLYSAIAQGMKRIELAKSEGVTDRTIRNRMASCREFVQALIADEQDELDKHVRASIRRVAGRLQLAETTAGPLPVVEDSEPESYVSEPIDYSPLPARREWSADHHTTIDDIRAVFSNIGRRFAPVS